MPKIEMPGTREPVAYLWRKWGDALCEFCAADEDHDDLIAAQPVYRSDREILYVYCADCDEQTHRLCDCCREPLFDSASFIDYCACARI